MNLEAFTNVVIQEPQPLPEIEETKKGRPTYWPLYSSLGNDLSNMRSTLGSGELIKST